MKMRLLLTAFVLFAFLQISVAQRYEVSDYLGSQGSASAEINAPYGLAIDSRGNMWVANEGGHNIVYYNGSSFKLALGAASQSGYDGGVGVSTRFSGPKSLMIANIDGSETLVVCDAGNDAVRMVDISNISSLSTTKSEDFTGFNDPSDVAMDADGNIYVADRMNYCIKKIDADGNLTVFAGQEGTSGTADGSATGAARFKQPTGLYVEGTDVYVGDANNVRKISNGQVSTIELYGDFDNWSFDMGPLFNISDIGKVGDRWFLADGCSIRRFDVGSDVYQTAAGGNYANDCGYATDKADTLAKFRNIKQITYDDGADIFYVTDSENQLVRRIELSGNSIAKKSQSEKLTVYPNPATSQVFIQGFAKWQGKQVSLSVLDITGQVVYHKTAIVKSEQMALNLDALNSGLYLVQIAHGESIITKKLYLR